MLGGTSPASLPLATMAEPSVRFEARASFHPGYKPGAARFVARARMRSNADNRIFAATEDFTSRPDDMVSSRLFVGTVRQALRFTRSILGGDGFDSATLGLGEMILTNTSGEYDHLIGSHAVDGRPVRVRLGGAGEAYNSFATVFDGQSTGWHVNEQELVIELRDFGYLLETPVSPNTYAGTGGAEGGEDIKGKRKPRPFGIVRDITPALLTRGTSLLHQVNDGPVADIPAVYVRGAALGRGPDHASREALEAAEIAKGTYQTCLRGGFFRLQYLLDGDDGRVTADVRADADASTGAIVARLLRQAGVDRLDAASFAAVAARQSAPIGFFVATGEEAEIVEVISRLMRGVGGWGGFRRDGTYQIGILDAPTGPARARFGEIEIVDIDREPLPAALEVPARRIRVGWGINWTPQDSDLAGSLSDARRDFLKEDRRLAEASDERILRNHPLARDPEPVEAFFDREVDALTEARRLLRLWRVPHSLYRATLKTHPFGLDLGDVADLTYPRWDLKAGRLGSLVLLDEDTENDLVEVVLFS